MNTRKEYKAPRIRTETIQVGVFGSYGNDTGGGSCSPIQFFNPLFHFCCS